MAKKPYPKMGAKAWTALRAKAAAAPSTKFTPEVVAPLMSMSNPNSALDNVVRPMRQLGLIDDEGVLTDRGNKWRVDASYKAACEEILKEIYPEELGSFVDDDANPDATAIRTWFDQRGFGDSNARKMSATYVLIAGKHKPEPPSADPSKSGKKASTRKKASTKFSDLERADEAQANAVVEQSPTRPSEGPTVHLDIQIHIPADATPEQIDLIFSSMARHLYAN